MPRAVAFTANEFSASGRVGSDLLKKQEDLVADLPSTDDRHVAEYKCVELVPFIARPPQSN